MPASKDDEAKESKLVSFLAFLAMVVGAVLAVVSSRATQSESLWAVDRLVRVDTSYENSMPVLTTRKVFCIMLGVGVSVCVAAIIGCLGAVFRHKKIVCCYVVLAAIFTLSMVAGGVQTIQRKFQVEELVSEQVETLCEPEMYMKFGLNLPCSWGAIYNRSGPGCGPPCEKRLEVLRDPQVDGCGLLPILCKDFTYTQFAATECTALALEQNQEWYAIVADASGCEAFCNEDIVCQQYIVARSTAGMESAAVECVLMSGLPARHPAPTWTALPLGQGPAHLGNSEKSCYKRVEPLVLEKFRESNSFLSMMTIILACVLFCSTSVTCCLMYNVNVKRKGKPTGCELFIMLFPCCGEGVRKKFDGRKFQRTGSGESEDDDEAKE